MGGASAEISPSTVDVALEMAWFLPRSVGRTSRRLGLRTEASARFERGCDPEVIDLAAARFATLAGDDLRHDARPREGGRAGRAARPHPDPGPHVAAINQVLGTDLGAAEVVDLLDPIGFVATAAPDVEGDLDVAIPSWRYDSAVEIDVVEEVARHFGYANIPRRELATSRPGRLSAVQRRRREVRRLLTGLGLTEVMPLPFLAPGDLTACGFPADGIELRNSLVAEESVLRTTLLPGLVQAVATNATRRSTGVRLFEVGHVFLPADSASAEGPGRPDLLPDEREHLGVALAGAEAPEAVRTWLALAARLGLPDVDVANEARPGLHPTRSAVARVAGEVVGSVGEIDPDVLAAHGIAERVAWLEVDLGTLAGAGRGRRRVPARLAGSPPATSTWPSRCPAAVSAVDVERTLVGASPLVWSVDLFDTYRGPGVADDTRSLAYRVRFDSSERTLTDAEVAEARQALIDAVVASHASHPPGLSHHPARPV